MKRQARILACDGSGKALVEIDSISQCRRCSRAQGCGAGMLATGQTGLQLWINTDKPQRAIPGQAVLVEIDDSGSGWLWPVFGAYGLPLAGLLSLTTVASYLTTFMAEPDKLSSAVAELMIVASAAAGLCGGIVAWRRVAPRVLARAERSLCLQTARIVGMQPSTEREP